RRDGLEIIWGTFRPPSVGNMDLSVSTRPSTSDPWSTPISLGPVVNSVGADNRPALSFDGTELYFQSTRSGGFGAQDLYVSRRTKLKQPDYPTRLTEKSREFIIHKLVTFGAGSAECL